MDSRELLAVGSGALLICPGVVGTEYVTQRLAVDLSKVRIANGLSPLTSSDQIVSATRSHDATQIAFTALLMAAASGSGGEPAFPVVVSHILSSKLNATSGPIEFAGNALESVPFRLENILSLTTHREVGYWIPADDDNSTAEYHDSPTPSIVWPGNTEAVPSTRIYIVWLFTTPGSEWDSMCRGIHWGAEDVRDSKRLLGDDIRVVCVDDGFDAKTSIATAERLLKRVRYKYLICK